LDEVPFDKIPSRLNVTRQDLRRIAVVTDGLDYTLKIERQYLKPVIKGPDHLLSAYAVKRTPTRLFDVTADYETLKELHANGALSYLRRGETMNYKTSDDDLKGGIPAQRSQVRNRKPYWYSLGISQRSVTRIVLPEHVDKRYVATLVEASDGSVVIDTLYVFEPGSDGDARLIHAGLNTLLTWYQIELRGRSQHGEGVLKVKIPDYGGISVLNASRLTTARQDRLLELFSRVPDAGSRQSFGELGTADRRKFDLAYLELCGFDDPPAIHALLELELRALAGERAERKLSVADAKVSRRKMTNIAATIDAYATRIVAQLQPHPDPRTFVATGAQTAVVPITAKIDGALEVGTELFNQGEVLTGNTCVAKAGSVFAAQFVRGVLLLEPDRSEVQVPVGDSLNHTISNWNAASRRWHKQFKAIADRQLSEMDAKLRQQIEHRALHLLHAT
jgi:hypothetical protein